MIYIFTGGRPSNGAKELSALDGFKRLIEPRAFKAGDAIINWGTSNWGNISPMGVPKLINTVDAIKQASNKFHAFGTLAGANVDTVPWTANMAVAKEWQNEGAVVIVRKILTGHSGNGIVVLEKGDDLIEAPLYTKYIFKVKEFRVHATTNQVIDTQQKVRDPAVEPLSWKIRSHANGFIFQRNNIEANLKRDLLAVKAIQQLGLHFGAVDIIEDKKGNFYVLEVNTAPGIEGQTITNYAAALKELANAGG